MDATPNNRKREECLSSDGKWRSFPKVPNLLQYVSNGNYYGRIKVGGKLIRESLGTAFWTKAKLRLVDFQKKHNESRHQVVVPLKCVQNALSTTKGHDLAGQPKRAEVSATHASS